MDGQAGVVGLLATIIGLVGVLLFMLGIANALINEPAVNDVLFGALLILVSGAILRSSG